MVDALRALPPADATARLAAVFEGMLAGAGDEALLGPAGVADADTDVLTAPVRERLRAMLGAATAQGVTGMVADLSGYALGDWSFTPSQVAADVLLAYVADDERVPPAHGEWYRDRLRSAQLQLWPGVGHVVVVVPAWGGCWSTCSDQRGRSPQMRIRGYLSERRGPPGACNVDATAALVMSGVTYPRSGGPTMARYAAPGTDGSVVTFKPRYDHFIGGEYVAPKKGQYFENPTPITGETFTEVARGTAEDVEAALDAAHAAAPAWGKTSAADRANVLNKMADRVEANLEKIAIAESWENGKACRETLAADIPLAVDHLRYFAGALRAQEGSLSEIDENTIAYHFHEPLGVVGQIIPWNFPILMAIWKLAPAIAAGNAVVLKPAEQTPASIHVLNELVADLLPPGVLNIVNGFGVEAGKPLASSKRIRKIAFTGETTTGRLIMQYASENLIPVTLELGGKSPNVFFDDVAAKQDEFYDKALEGFAMFALNQGEVCTCPSRALIQGGMYSDFLADGVKRVEQIKQGDPLDTETMVGAQASNDQLEKILSYIDIGRQEGAKILAGGERSDLGGSLSGGYYVQPTIFEGDNSMRIFQEEIFGPVVSVARFSDYDDAIKTANDTLYGLGAGVWSRDTNTAYRAGRDIQAGRVWVNNYHAYPAHAAFGGYKQSGIGRENHKMMLDHYQQTKNMLVSYSPNALGFF
jgi:aldehyde dehydrogenase